MTDHPPVQDPKRRSNLRTVLLLGAITLAIYVAFILSGVFGAAGGGPR